MYKTLAVLIFISTFILNSCSKQSASGVSDPELRSAEEQQRLDACSNVNFNKGVLLYQNVQLLFKCTKWDKEFPAMFKSIQNISGDSWNQAFSPLNEAFLENQVRRDRVFRHIRDLDSKNGLDDLSYVIVALNETNFFDSVKDMFKCVENPTNDLCKSRKNIPQKASLKNIIHLINTDPMAASEMSQLLKVLITAATPSQEIIRNEINKFRFINNYLPLRLKLVDNLAQKIKNGLSEEDRTFAVKLLTIEDSSNQVPWLYKWLQDEKLGRIKFRDLLEFPALTNPEIIDEVKGISLLYDRGLNCTIKKDNSSNELIDFDLKIGIGDYLKTIKQKDYKSFYDYSSIHITGLAASTEICKEIVKNEYNTNLVKAAVRVADFFSEKKNYDLLKFVLSFTTSQADPSKTFSENIYFGDFLAQDIFKSINDLNAHIGQNTREFLPVVFDVLVKLPPESIINLANVLTEVSKKENDKSFVGVADFWSFFSSEEKNYVFNFLDRHFDKDINYLLLFDFYSKLLDEYKEVQPLFKTAWSGSVQKDEDSYLALQDMFYNFSGKETLQDFKKFFSRDQILKVLEVLSNGQKITDQAREEIAYRDSTNYVLRSKAEKYKYTVKYSSENDMPYDAKTIVLCMQKFNEIQNGFYELIRNLPEACKAVTKDNVSLRLFGWLNFIDNDYSGFKKPSSPKESLFDESGLLSPYMLNTNIGLLKILDSVVGPYGSTEPTVKGVDYLLNSLNFYVNKSNGIKVVEKDANLLSQYLDVNAENNIIFRNGLIKSFTKKDNFEYSKSVISNISDLIFDFGIWVQSGAYTKAINRSLGSFDQNNTCEKTINKYISNNACPSKEAVKTWGNDLLFYLQNTWEPEMGSPLKYLLTGAKMGGYLNVPLNSKNTFKFRLTLADNIKYLFDTFDRSLPVNNQSIKFENEDGKTASVNLTTIERVETVIREVRFERNYLGATYLNHVVEGDDYVKDVKERKKLMVTCLKIPGMRCGRKMSDSDQRMSRNALEAFDSLLDIDNGRGLESRLHYGTFLKAFQQTLIASSSKEAQALSLFPLKDEVLKRHNGVVLGDLTMVNGFSNTARFIKDRVGRTRTEFENFLNREDFKRVDRTLLYGFEMGQSIPAAEKIINKLRLVPVGEKQNLFGHLVDWISGLTYDESRLVEDTISKLLVVGSYLGTPDIVFNLPSKPIGFERYENNNLFQMFLALDKTIEYWPTLKNYFPAGVKLIDAIKPINTFLFFFTEKLALSNDPQENKTYIALNDLFYVLQATLFDSVSDGRILGNNQSTFKGIDFIVEGFKNSKLVANTFLTIRDNYNFVDKFFENNGSFFLSIGQNIKRICSNSKIDFTPIRDYLNFTSKNMTCVVGDSTCMRNFHYDEPANLVKYVLKNNENGISYLAVLNQNVFNDNFDQISNMIGEVLPCLKIKNVKIPFIVN